MEQRSYCDYPEFYAPLFEVTRRYKVMNPEKMRDTYGKLVYMLQVCCSLALSRARSLSLALSLSLSLSL